MSYLILLGLIPSILALAAIGTFLWKCYGPNPQLDWSIRVTAGEWAMIAVMCLGAAIVGHSMAVKAMTSSRVIA